ncbi:putative retroelement [Panicum miliaceum]|uniref:Retroelement n=1 Tax=Panicum miliaceum TaxID=4540 RepID=A0A3L6S0N6_PANMI|nr:putative retroelement [Panicum miliaceum]
MKVGALGDGKMTDFWRDQWCGAISFKEMFPEIFKICNDQSGTVAKFATRGWRLTFRRWLNENLQSQVRKLRDMLTSFALSDDRDIHVWTWEKAGLQKPEDQSALDAGEEALKEAALYFHPKEASPRDTGMVLHCYCIKIFGGTVRVSVFRCF